VGAGPFHTSPQSRSISTLTSLPSRVHEKEGYWLSMVVLEPLEYLLELLRVVLMPINPQHQMQDAPMGNMGGGHAAVTSKRGARGAGVTPNPKPPIGSSICDTYVSWDLRSEFQ